MPTKRTNANYDNYISNETMPTILTLTMPTILTGLTMPNTLTMLTILILPILTKLINY